MKYYKSVTYTINYDMLNKNVFVSNVINSLRSDIIDSIEPSVECSDLQESKEVIARIMQKRN